MDADEESDEEGLLSSSDGSEDEELGTSEPALESSALNKAMRAHSQAMHHDLWCVLRSVCVSNNVHSSVPLLLCLF